MAAQALPCIRLNHQKVFLAHANHPGKFLHHLCGSTVDAASAERCLPPFLPSPPVGGRTLVIGAGKAAAQGRARR